MNVSRYALYYIAPRNAEWGERGAAWLGWDVSSGRARAHPPSDLPISDITATPRKYGLHGTIKPPFRLADGLTPAALETECARLARSLDPVDLDGFAVARLGRFLALRPIGDDRSLSALAANCVEALDPFRAPAGAPELARRRAAGLTNAQEANLMRWGYPYVMDEFRFHITLTGRLEDDLLARAEAWLTQFLDPVLPKPVRITELALVGEAEDGRFHLLHRYPLGA